MTAELPRVLLVDDRRENLLALEAVLEPLPCELVSVTSGDAALKQLLTKEFAVALLDVQMPEMDGFETAELIKGRERTRTLPIIFVTAISKERHHIFRGYSSGAVDYVLKPYDPGILRSKVSVFLELHAKSQAAARSEALLKTAFDHAPIGLARMDTDGTVAEANRSLAELLGRKAIEFQGRPFESLLHPDHCGPDAPWRSALTGSAIDGLGHELRLLAAGGEEIPCEVRMSFARADGLAPDTLIVQVQDLRDRLQIEKERERRGREQAARAQAERVSQRLHAVQSITDAALDLSGFDELMGSVLRRTAGVLSVDAAAVVLYESDGAVAVYHGAGGVESGLQRRRRPATGLSSAAEALGEASASTLAVPLIVSGRQIGELHVGTLFPRSFDSEDTAVLGLAADRVAATIERARLYEREHVIATELQHSLLPDRLPELPGLSTAARYRPAGAGSEVGGDWYDAIVQPGGQLLLVIGDVAGRGIVAASTMGQLRSAVRAYALDGHAPAALLDRLNAFQSGLRGDAMATVALVAVDLEAELVRYASAGHPPGLIVAADGDSRWLDEVVGPPLGAAADLSYREGEAHLGSGATLVLYTDGLVEIRGEHLDRGLDRLRAAAAGGPREAEALCDAIVEQALNGVDTGDDVTLLVLQTVSAEQPRVAIDVPADASALSAMRATAKRWLSRASGDETEVYEVVLAINEAVENSIEHGMRGQGEAIELVLERIGDDLEITVRDRGSWREGSTADRGRGLVLMRAVMDDVSVEPGDRGTAVILRRRLRSPLAVAKDVAVG